MSEGQSLWNVNNRTTAEGLFAVADAIRYLADTISECPVKDLVADVCEAMKYAGATAEGLSAVADAIRYLAGEASGGDSE